MKLEEIRQQHKETFFDKVREELVKLGTEQADFIYNTKPLLLGCHYNGPAHNSSEDNGERGPECSGCIVGQALQRLGWDDADELDFSGYVNELIGDCPLDIVEVQQKQDCGVSWGQSILSITKP